MKYALLFRSLDYTYKYLMRIVSCYYAMSNQFNIFDFSPITCNECILYSTWISISQLWYSSNIGKLFGFTFESMAGNFYWSYPYCHCQFSMHSLPEWPMVKVMFYNIEQKLGCGSCLLRKLRNQVVTLSKLS